jgi:hypothetical protein
VNTLGDVKGKLRALLGDPDGEWLTDGYITPLIDATYGAQYLRIKNACGQNLEAVKLVPNVPPGTTTLLEFQDEGEPLEGLYTPDQVWAKPAGTPVNFFKRGHGPHQLPHIAPPGLQAPANNWVEIGWDWLGNALLITPVTTAIDVEVWGRFNPPALQDDADVLVVDPSMWVATSFGAAAVVGIERTNPQILQGYAATADAACDNIVAELVRQMQPNPIRLRRIDRNTAGFYGYRWQR